MRCLVALAAALGSAQASAEPGYAMLGGCNVLPRGLGLTPDDGGFWLRASDLP